MSSLRQWDRLPEGVLNLMFQRLDQLSRIRSSAVCKSWTSAIKFAADHERFWLLLPRKLASEYLSFFDVCEGAVFKLKLPESFRGKQCWVETSSDGRWIVVKTGRHSLLEISLLDPFSGLQITLPRLRKIRDGVCIDPRNIKLQLFSLDGSQSIVAALLDKRTIGFCKLGGNEWIYHHENFLNASRWEDICFSNGILCLLDGKQRDRTEWIAQTRYVNLDGNDIILKLIPNSQYSWRRPITDSKSCNLLEYNGKMFQIHIYKEKYKGRGEFVLTKFRPSDDTVSEAKVCTSWKNQTLLVARGITAFIPEPNFKELQRKCASFLEEYAGDDSGGHHQHEISIECGVYEDDYFNPSLRIIKSNLRGYLPIVKIRRF